MAEHRPAGPERLFQEAKAIRRPGLTAGAEAALDIAGATLTWLLAAAALPVIIIGNLLFITSFSGEPAPTESLVAVIVYDLALASVLLVFKRSARSRVSVVLLAFVLAPAAVIGATTLIDRIAVERSNSIIY